MATTVELDAIRIESTKRGFAMYLRFLTLMVLFFCPGEPDMCERARSFRSTSS